MEFIVIGLKERDFAIKKNNQVYFSEGEIGNINSGDFFAYKISESEFFLALKNLSNIDAYKDQRLIMVSNHSPLREIEVYKYGWQKVLHSQIHTIFVLMLNNFFKSFDSNQFVDSKLLLKMFLKLNEFSENNNKLKFSILKKIKGELIPLEKNEIINGFVYPDYKNQSNSDFEKSIDLLKTTKKKKNKFQARKKHTVILQHSKIYEQAVRHYELKNLTMVNSYIELNYKIKGFDRDKKRIKKRMEDSLFLTKNKKRRSTGWKEQRNRKKQWKTKNYKFDINQLHPNVFCLFHG